MEQNCSLSKYLSIGIYTYLMHLLINLLCYISITEWKMKSFISYLGTAPQTLQITIRGPSAFCPSTVHTNI